MAETVDWRCACGAMRARIAIDDGTRLICYCDDCQAFARILGHAEMLDEAGGTDLFQTTPDKVEITMGAEHLSCLRLTSKGPLRWSASCCGSPFANTLTTRQVPFSSLMVSGMADPDGLGPVIARVNRKFATQKVAASEGSMRRIVAAVLGRALRARLSGRYRRTPFFAQDGRPVTEVRRPSAVEMKAAYRR